MATLMILMPRNATIPEEVTELEEVTNFDNIEGTVRYKGRLYKSQTKITVPIAQVKANKEARDAKAVEKIQMVNKIVAEMRSNGNWSVQAILKMV